MSSELSPGTTVGEFCGAYARAMADISAKGRGDFQASRSYGRVARCEDCNHRSYLCSCECSTKGCPCLHTRGQKRGSGKLPEPELPLPILTAEQLEVFSHD